MTTMLRAERSSARVGEAVHPRYLLDIRRFPLLEPQEGHAVAKRWCDRGDRRSASAGDEPSAPGGQDRDRVSRLWFADLRVDVGRQCRAHGASSDPNRSSGWPPTRCGGSRRRSQSISCAPVVGEDGTTVNQKKLFFNLRRPEPHLGAGRGAI